MATYGSKCPVYGGVWKFSAIQDKPVGQSFWPAAASEGCLRREKAFGAGNKSTEFLQGIPFQVPRIAVDTKKYMQRCHIVKKIITRKRRNNAKYCADTALRITFFEGRPNFKHDLTFAPVFYILLFYMLSFLNYKPLRASPAFLSKQ